MTIISAISKVEINRAEAIKGEDIRPGIFHLIKEKYTEFSKEDYISLEELNLFRRAYLAKLMHQERGELLALDKDVMNAVKNNAVLTENIQDEIDTQISLGDRLADKIASFGGSWAFIITFFSFIVMWMAVNIFLLSTKAFDPYPFILLNLILSCLAAIQAPIIMMSQNRQEQKDRIRGEHDYKVNLKAELEIKLLSEKMDHLIIHQNKKLLEIQEVQIDYLEDLMKKIKKD